MEADLLAFFRVEVDIDQDQFGGWSAERLFSTVERLGAYDGAVTARFVQYQEDLKRHNPSHATIEKHGVSVVEGTGANLAAHPELADGEYVRV